MEVCDLGHSSSLFTCGHIDKKLAADSGAFNKIYQDSFLFRMADPFQRANGHKSSNWTIWPEYRALVSIVGKIKVIFVNQNFSNQNGCCEKKVYSVYYLRLEKN